VSEAPVPGCSLVISSLVVRRAIGAIGIALPFVLASGGFLLYETGLQSSISGYYHTGMRDVFVGAVCAIAVFLMSYKGYEPDDDRAADLACIFAVGIALFPVTPDSDPTMHQKVIGYLHLLCAALFYLTLAYFSLFLFTKTGKSKTPTRKKLQRNAVYRACGYTMLAALGLAVVFALLPTWAIPEVKRLEPVFWLESLTVSAFGISWLTKGETLLKDDA
jgi:hypothetical protein